MQSYYLISVKHLASGRITHRRLQAVSSDDAGRRAIELIVGPQAMPEHDATPRYEVTAIVAG